MIAKTLFVAVALGMKTRLVILFVSVQGTSQVFLIRLFFFYFYFLFFIFFMLHHIETI